VAKRISIVIGIVLAIFAVFLIKLFLDQQTQKVDEKVKEIASQMQASQSSVLVANQNISAGAPLDATMFESVVVPSDKIPPQAARSLAEVVGMVTSDAIPRGAPINLTKLVPGQGAPSGPSSTTLSMVTPPGKRGITIPVDNLSSVGGMIRPGDYVDVICSISSPTKTAEGKEVKKEGILPIFQNVLVLAVGQEIAEPGGYKRPVDKKENAPAAPIVTLAVTPEEANILAFVQEQGKIRLILRAPSDSQVSQLKPIGWDNLLKYLTPAEARKPDKAKEEPTEEIEIYRGVERQVMPLSK